MNAKTNFEGGDELVDLDQVRYRRLFEIPDAAFCVLVVGADWKASVTNPWGRLPQPRRKRREKRTKN